MAPSVIDLTGDDDDSEVRNTSTTNNATSKTPRPVHETGRGTRNPDTPVTRALPSLRRQAREARAADNIDNPTASNHVATNTSTANNASFDTPRPFHDTKGPTRTERAAIAQASSSQQPRARDTKAADNIDNGAASNDAVAKTSTAKDNWSYTPRPLHETGQPTRSFWEIVAEAPPLMRRLAREAIMAAANTDTSTAPNERLNKRSRMTQPDIGSRVTGQTMGSRITGAGPSTQSQFAQTKTKTPISTPPKAPPKKQPASPRVPAPTQPTPAPNNNTPRIMLGRIDLTNIDAEGCHCSNCGRALLFGEGMDNGVYIAGCKALLCNACKDKPCPDHGQQTVHILKSNHCWMCFEQIHEADLLDVPCGHPVCEGCMRGFAASKGKSGIFYECDVCRDGKMHLCFRIINANNVIRHKPVA
ncbi:hypothetical protein BDV96DRAFT_608003 [Lophiotrema nucula]|uniref:RING-type domain-containing protein n=1 Tax=Lophiotrema nucula TaxID=690887 RepID=A0A6A5YH99_9PLEO|nr:hypothetical protein BDV96DRAFT_608003 [Lophiotrema nucula]